MTKKVFTKFERLKKKWKMSASNNFYAYPKIVSTKNKIKNLYIRKIVKMIFLLETHL